MILLPDLPLTTKCLEKILSFFSWRISPALAPVKMANLTKQLKRSSQTSSNNNWSSSLLSTRWRDSHLLPPCSLTGLLIKPCLNPQLLQELITWMVIALVVGFSGKPLNWYLLRIPLYKVRVLIDQSWFGYSKYLFTNWENLRDDLFCFLCFLSIISASSCFSTTGINFRAFWY